MGHKRLPCLLLCMTDFCLLFTIKKMQHIVVYCVYRTERIELRTDEFSGRGGMARRGRGGVSRGAVTESGFNRFGKREFERHSGSDRT